MTVAPIVLDLEMLGTSQALAAYALPEQQKGAGHVLIDCGPSTTSKTLLSALDRAGLDARDVGHLLLTHIHLDHAGAAGHLAKRLHLTVHVHARGARHLAEPSRLLSSAARLFGPRMHDWWGEMLAVPTECLAVVTGETLQVGGYSVRALDTPGHASHHLVYQVEDVLFTGDVAGVRLPWMGAPIPATPPPDIHFGRWQASLERLLAVQASRLYLSHFGEVKDVALHLHSLAERLSYVAELVRRGDELGESTEQLVYVLRAALSVEEDATRAYRPEELTGTDVEGVLQAIRRQN